MPPAGVPQTLLERRAALAGPELRLLADESRAFNQERLRFMPDEYIGDLEVQIAMLRAEL
jgi:hypothetical protein